MFSRIHNRLGTAGFAIAIVALVAALAGTAWAALPGLNSKQKSEVKKIAKKFAGKPGATGPIGPIGPAGKDGTNRTNGATRATGPTGAAGTNGTNGTNGKNVVTGTEATGTANCEERGGVWVEVEGSGVKRYVCNGESASTSKTMTGDWSFKDNGMPAVWMSVSFPRQLSAEPTFNWIPPFPLNQPTAACPGSYQAPAAEPGNLCFYAGEMVESGAGENQEPEGYENLTADKLSGATLRFELPTESGRGFGSWAVTE